MLLDALVVMKHSSPVFTFENMKDDNVVIDAVNLHGRRL